LKIKPQIDKKKIGIIVAYFLIYVVWGYTYYFIGVAIGGLASLAKSNEALANE
jgi:hypothetical protein